MRPDARARYDRGIELFTAKDYAGAIRELEAGHALEPRREFLFAEAQALRLEGDCHRAVPLYQKFLASEPTPVQVNATHIALSRCAQQLATEAAKTPPPSPNVDARPPPPAPVPPPSPVSWYRDPIGGALLGAAVVGLGVGTGFLIASASARDDAQRSTTYADFNRLWDSAASRRDVAIVALAAGGALTGAAIYRYLHLARRENERERAGAVARKSALGAPRPWLGAGAGGVAIGGRF